MVSGRIGAMNREIKMALLGSVISGELGQMKGKMDFWQVEAPVAGTVWETGNSLKLEEVLAMFGSEKDFEDSEMGILLGIGWEFVWGQEPPEKIRDLRELVRIKAHCGLEMTELEKLWLNLIAVDTDMF